MSVKRFEFSCHCGESIVADFNQTAECPKCTCNGILGENEDGSVLEKVSNSVDCGDVRNGCRLRFHSESSGYWIK